MSKYELQAGDLLDDRFELEELLKRGGMASIFKATDRLTGKKVAVKAPYLNFESDPAFFDRFQREAEVGKRLKHPYILRFHPPAEQSRPYIVTEYLEGQTLAERMKEIRPLPVDESLQIAVQICEALTHMHEQGIVHRDLKPDNIMICPDGTLRLMDFGIAKADALRRLTFVGFTAPMGTPDYMAPEQVRGKRGDARTDVYGLGAMLYEMITGSVPFSGPNTFLLMNQRLAGDPVAPRKLRPEIPAGVEEIILHAMERDSRRRYASAAAMKAELDDPDEVEVTGRCERLVAPTKWRTQWIAKRTMWFCVLLPILAIGAALLISHWRRH